MTSQVQPDPYKAMVQCTANEAKYTKYANWTRNVAIPACVIAILLGVLLGQFITPTSGYIAGGVAGAVCLSFVASNRYCKKVANSSHERYFAEHATGIIANVESHIARAEQDQKLNISQYVEKYYLIDPRSTASVEEAEIFLLTSTNSFFVEALQHARFINQFENDESLVMVESCPKLQTIKAHENLSTYALEQNRDVIGWDLGTFKDYTEISLPYEKRFDTHSVLISLAKNKDTQGLIENLKEADKGYKANTQAMDQNPDLSHLMSVAFRMRTKSMVETLQEVSKNQRNKPRRDFLIAGDTHLIDCSVLRKDINYSLKIFDDYIKTQKVVILTAKAIFINPEFESIRLLKTE